MIQVAVALLFAALVGCATLDPGTTPASDYERQLLVMITAAAPHYRPGTSASGYGSGATRPRFDLAGLALARDHGMTLADDWPMPALGLHCFVSDRRGTLARNARCATGRRSSRRVGAAGAAFPHAGPELPDHPMQSSARVLDLDRLHQIATGRKVDRANRYRCRPVAPRSARRTRHGAKLRRRQQLCPRSARHGGGRRDRRPRRQQPRHRRRSARRHAVATARLLAGAGDADRALCRVSH